MLQPNFREIFFQTFVDHKLVSYQVRNDSNFLHDIQFLYSLIRDSRFELKDVHFDKRTLTIPLIRGRWENQKQVENYNLLKTHAVLTFKKVKSVRWIVGDIHLKAPFSNQILDTEDSTSDDVTCCEIDELFVGKTTYSYRSDCFEIILVGHPRNWSLRVSLPREGWAISVKDLPTQDNEV